MLFLPLLKMFYRIVLIGIVTLIPYFNFAQQAWVDSIVKNRGEVELMFVKPSTLDLYDLTQQMSIVRRRGDTIWAFFNQKQYQQFKNYAIPFQVIQPLKRISKQPLSANSWSVYPSYTEYVSKLKNYVQQYPEYCTLVWAGKTVKGRDIWFIRINTDTTVYKPSVMLSATMHGNETGGFMLLLRTIDYLLSNPMNNLVKLLVDSLDIWINPNANPDGTYFDSTNIYQATRFNANGVDLNRNFPDPIMGNHPDGNAYQPETYTMMQIMSKHHFVLSANFHSGEEVVNYPWDSQPTLHPDNLWFRAISKKYADTAIAYGPINYFNTIIGNELIRGITNGYTWYPVYGGRQDYITYFRRGREVTIEIDNNFITPETNLEQLWNANYRSIVNFLANALTGIKGRVLISNNQLPIKAMIEITGIDTDVSKVYSDSLNGYFVRLLLPGNYMIRVTANGFIKKEIAVQVNEQNLTPLNIGLLSSDNYLQHPESASIIIYPDPVKDIFYLLPYSLTGVKTISIINISGTRLAKYNYISNSGINVHQLPSGIYFLEITYFSGKKEMRKFVKL